MPRRTPPPSPCRLLIVGLGLALLLPVIPFSLELLALRRLTAAAFGTLISLEPAIALIVGLTVLGQAPRTSAFAGIALVVGAGIGAERTGAHVEDGRRQPSHQPVNSVQDRSSKRWQRFRRVGHPLWTVVGDPNLLRSSH